MFVSSTKAALSQPRRRLVELMQQLNFGRIENLTILEGEPILDPPPRQVKEYKFGGENCPRPELNAEDFPLKSQLVELFHAFDEMGDGVIEVLEIKHGVPFRMMLPQTR